jgi:hypothetical protein
MPNATEKTTAGWTKGVRRQGSLNVLDEYMTAVGTLAKAERVPKGVIVERALLAYMEAHPNGAGAQALKAVAKVRKHAEGARGYTPRKGGREWAAMVDQWGPAPYRPRPCFTWKKGQGPLAHREAAQGIAHQCLWCDTHTRTGAEVLEHDEGCPTLSS